MLTCIRVLLLKKSQCLGALSYFTTGMYNEITAQEFIFYKKKFSVLVHSYILLLRFGRSCLIVGHHHLANDFLPEKTAVFGCPCCDIVIFVHCMMSMYCFRDLLRLRLPSTYHSTTVLSFSNVAAMIICKGVQSTIDYVCERVKVTRVFLLHVIFVS